MRSLFFILIFGLTACNDSGSGGAQTTAPVSNLLPSPNTQPDTTQKATISVYSLSFTDAPVNGWPLKTYTATGSCVLYNSLPYCWDDGIKTIDFTSGNFRYGPLYYTYFGVELKNIPTICYGGCDNDIFSQPTQVTMDISNAMPSGAVDKIFSTGTRQDHQCTVSGQQIVCDSFTINL